MNKVEKKKLKMKENGEAKIEGDWNIEFFSEKGKKVK